MDTVEQAQQSIRTVESRGNYTHQQGVTVQGQRDRKVGAYGILESKWEGLVDSLGYQGARWDDRKMQDVVAREALTRYHTSLGSWELAVVAFRFGLPVARKLQKDGYTEPQDIEASGYPGVATYMRSVRRNEPKTQQPVEGSIPVPEEINMPPKKTPALNKAEGIIRDKLVFMRDAQRKQDKAVMEEESLGGDN